MKYTYEEWDEVWTSHGWERAMYTDWKEERAKLIGALAELLKRTPIRYGKIARERAISVLAEAKGGKV